MKIRTLTSTFVKQHPIISFTFFACAFSWWLWPLYIWGFSPAVIVGFGPFLAALVMLGLTGGKPAIKRLLRQMIQWRIPARWYLAAMGLPFVITGLAAVFNILLGAPVPSTEKLSQWPSIIPTFFMLIIIPGIGGAWEEPGWRGYALNELATRRTQLAASFVLAIPIAIWHLPLFVTGIIPLADLLYLFGTVVIFNWIYFYSKKSVLIIMIFHAMNNAMGQFFPSLFTDGYVEQLALFQALVCILVALLVVVSNRSFWIGRPLVQVYHEINMRGDPKFGKG